MTRLVKLILVRVINEINLLRWNLNIFINVKTNRSSIYNKPQTEKVLLFNNKQGTSKSFVRMLRVDNAHEGMNFFLSKPGSPSMYPD